MRWEEDDKIVVEGEVQLRSQSELDDFVKLLHPGALRLIIGGYADHTQRYLAYRGKIYQLRLQSNNLYRLRPNEYRKHLVALRETIRTFSCIELPWHEPPKWSETFKAVKLSGKWCLQTQFTDSSHQIYKVIIDPQDSDLMLRQLTQVQEYLDFEAHFTACEGKSHEGQIYLTVELPTFK